VKFKLFCLESTREGAAHVVSEWSAFGKIVIRNPDTNEPYLTRYIIVRTPFFRVFLHRFHGPDPDRHVHNHPWRATSLILKGGYTEEVVRTPPSPFKAFRDQFAVGQWGNWWPCVNRLREDEYHRIVNILPGTWSLVFGGPYFRSWGFLVDRKHVDWRAYLNVEDGVALND
jgi:hypothetical protein